VAYTDDHVERSGSTLDDTQLILASREDPAAFRLLYDRWAERLLAYFSVRVRDPEVAAELLAETFAVAYARRHRFKDTGRPGGAWLYGIARKELAHFFRRRAVDTRALKRLGVAVPALDDESIARIEQLADVAQRKPALASALGQMSATERQAVELRVVDELDYREIAVRLGCSEGSARTRVHRGLARLASLMEVSA
jgi:RNA polymerase sigma factor (sigma-70 family)